MTIAQQLEQKGIEKGIRKGIRKGFLRGRQAGYKEGMLDVARNMRDNGFGDNIIIRLTGLTKDDMAKIRE